MQQKVAIALEDRLDINLLVTAEQKAESMILAALPALLDIVEPESIEAETGMDVDDTVVMAKGEDTSSVQPADITMAVEAHPALTTEVEIEYEEEKGDALTCMWSDQPTN